MKNKCDAWAVAAVYLLENEMGHYEYELTNFVVKSGISTLGEKGKTPHQTLKTILLKKKICGDDVFLMQGGGYYSLNRKEIIAQHNEVLLAHQLLKQKKEDVPLNEVKEQNKRLLKENQQLKAKLQEIKQLCDEA